MQVFGICIIYLKIVLLNPDLSSKQHKSFMDYLILTQFSFYRLQKCNPNLVYKLHQIFNHSENGDA